MTITIIDHEDKRKQHLFLECDSGGHLVSLCGKRFGIEWTLSTMNDFGKMCSSCLNSRWYR